LKKKNRREETKDTNRIKGAGGPYINTLSTPREGGPRSSEKARGRERKMVSGSVPVAAASVAGITFIKGRGAPEEKRGKNGGEEKKRAQSAEDEVMKGSRESGAVPIKSQNHHKDRRKS